jgi:hypothetical protein
MSNMSVLAKLTLYCYHLFLYTLFNDAFSVTQTIQHQMKELYVNDELERMWKEVAMA